MPKSRGLVLTGGLLAAGLIVGCAHKDPLVGTWSGTQTTPRGVVKNTWQFNADGSSTFSMQVVSGPQASLQAGAVGTYTVSGGTLTNSISSMSEGARTKTVATPKPEPFQYTLNGDTLTLTEPGMSSPLVLTRVTP